MFRSLSIILCAVLVSIFAGCAPVDSDPVSTIIYFRNIVAKADVLDIAGYAPVSGGSNIACIKNGTKAEAKLKITAEARYASNILYKNTIFLISRIDAVYTTITGTPEGIAGISVTGDPLLTIDYDKSADTTVTIRSINSKPENIPADAIYKYKLSFDVVGTERLLGQADYSGVFSVVWGSIYIVGKDVDCAEAIKK